MHEVGAEYRASNLECSCSYSPPEIPSRMVTLYSHFISYLDPPTPRLNRRLQPSPGTRNRLIRGVENPSSRVWGLPYLPYTLGGVCRTSNGWHIGFSAHFYFPARDLAVPVKLIPEDPGSKMGSPLRPSEKTRSGYYRRLGMRYPNR